MLPKNHLIEALKEVNPDQIERDPVALSLEHDASLSALTIQQAASVLGVSKHFVNKLLEQGELAYHRVGRHRRITLEEVFVYQQRSKVHRFAALDALMAEAQALGLGY